MFFNPKDTLMIQIYNSWYTWGLIGIPRTPLGIPWNLKNTSRIPQGTPKIPKCYILITIDTPGLSLIKIQEPPLDTPWIPQL